jgi:hypothetical protein
MTKQIDFDGYNEAEILKMYKDGACVCTVSEVLDGVTVRSDTNLILTNGVHFTLSEEELEQLNPTPEPAEEETI